MKTLAQQLLAALPQTQCTRCGYPDCAAYAEAMACDEAPINQCPPGGAQGISRLSAITGRPALALSPEHGVEGPRTTVFIDEDWCIGCTLCLKACPTDAIFGSHKTMHSVLESYCTGCELCLPVCPVDCIVTEPVDAGLAGWAAWPAELADQAAHRYALRQDRLARSIASSGEAGPFAPPTDATDADEARAIDTTEEKQRRQTMIEAALAKARSRNRQ